MLDETSADWQGGPADYGSDTGSSFEGQEGRSDCCYTSHLTTYWDDAPFRSLCPLP
jgi:hypothetical protein